MVRCIWILQHLTHSAILHEGTLVCLLILEGSTQRISSSMLWTQLCHIVLHCYISLHFALHCATATAHCVLHSALHLNASGQNCIGFQGTVSMGLTLHLTSKIQLWQRIKKVKEVLSWTILQQILSGKVSHKAHSFRSMFSILFHTHWTHLEKVGESPV